MGKSKGRLKGSRRKGSDPDSEDETLPEKDTTKIPSSSSGKLDFAEKREQSRKAAAEKRRSKMKCHLCGQAGHVRRECPGISDDGRGESKFTKSNGDAGATTLKKGNSTAKKGAKNRGRKEDKIEKKITMEELLPPGFSAVSDNAKSADDREESKDAEPFHFHDASCNGLETLEYLRFGRGKTKLSKNEAILEFQTMMDDVHASTNFGTCISHYHLKKGIPWNASLAYPIELDNVKFAIGLGEKFDGEDCDSHLLVETAANDNNIVGMVSYLDYSTDATSQSRQSCELQLQRLRCTCHAASQAGCPIQIRTSPSPSIRNEEKENDEDGEKTSPYSKLMVDLAKLLLEITASHPELKVHLSCWNGKAEHMNALLQTFPDNIWIGFDATVSFSKAKILHECAFDVPISKILLETGEPSKIPAKYAKAKGREAFCHSGLVPFIAESIAGRKCSSLEVTPENLARSASENTVLLYKI